MGSLSKFLGTPKEIEIDGEKIVLNPLKVKDLSKFIKTNPTSEESQELSKEIILLSIQDTSKEEIEQLSMDKFTKIMNEINKLNGFKDEQTERLTKRLGQVKERSTDN